MKEAVNALAGLVETVERAIESGDWLVDGACDPDSDLERARRVLRGLEGAEADMAKVKVRVAVAVDKEGNWNSAGGFWGQAMDAQWMAHALKIVHSGAASYWLEAELDVPQAPVVQAVVTKDGEP